MTRSLRHLALLTTVALSTAGCVMLGPDYQTPRAPLETDWLAFEDPRLKDTPPLAPEWWSTALRDPVLDQLVQIAMAEELTLRDRAQAESLAALGGTARASGAAAAQHRDR